MLPAGLFGLGRRELKRNSSRNVVMYLHVAATFLSVCRGAADKAVSSLFCCFLCWSFFGCAVLLLTFGLCTCVACVCACVCHRLMLHCRLGTDQV